jgi:putative transposase
VLADREIKISMDGKGAWRDNVFVERLWQTIKYEEADAQLSVKRPEIGHGVRAVRGFCPLHHILEIPSSAKMPLA